MEKFIITLTRQFGSLGRPIAQKMSEKLGIEFYDRDIVDKAAERLNLPVSKIDEQEEISQMTSSNGFFRMSLPLGSNKLVDTQDKIFATQENIIRFLTEKDSCIVVGRCSDFILRDEPNTIHIYIYAPYPMRVKNSVEELGLTEEEAKKMIREVDIARDAYHMNYAGFKPDDRNFKDLMVDSSLLGVEGTADLLVNLVRQKFHL